VTDDSYRIAPMRASDAERDAVVAALGENYQAGRLTADELDDRTGQALTARTLPELEDLMADLPPSGPGPADQAPLAARSTGALRPLVVPAAVVVMLVTVVLTLSSLHHHQPRPWLAIPIALLIARGIARRGTTRRL
jgi:hypothetical protein